MKIILFLFLVFLILNLIYTTAQKEKLSEKKLSERRRKRPLVDENLPFYGSVKLADEKIPFYHEKDAAVFILNKLNSQFSLLQDEDEDFFRQTQLIKNNFDGENVDERSISSMYTLLYSDSRSFLIGARNRLFNFSSLDLNDKKFLKRVSLKSIIPIWHILSSCQKHIVFRNDRPGTVDTKAILLANFKETNALEFLSKR